MIGQILSIFPLLLFINFVWMSGIYLHIPFCKKKCSYCDFHFSTSFGKYRNRMIETLCKEITDRITTLKEPIQTIYFGGGTPSLLTSEELDALFSILKTGADLSRVREVTLEANPDDINDSTLENWKKAGITRLSIGLQSFKSSDLEWMNRAHSVEEALQCVPLAQKHGFDNISVDLIYGLPNLTTNEWQDHISKVIAMDVAHISAYCLTIEEKTVLHQLVEKGKLKPAGDDQQSEQFEILSNSLVSAGYDHYEISNFGKPGKHAIHNGNYWKGSHYLGIGPSAHSYDGVTRRWNVSNNFTYMKMEGNLWFENEILEPKDRWNELLLTGLRTSIGVDQQQLFSIFTPDAAFSDKVAQFMRDGWMVIENEHYILTLEGRLKADYIASELFR